MFKIIDLGTTVPETYEQRVTLIQPGTFTKLASNDISRFWDSLEKDPKNSYLWVIAMTAGEYFGPNNNGDWFAEKDLQDWHHTFVSNANIFLHHNNKDPKQAVGKPIFSFYNEPMHRVEVILSLDKSNPKNKETILRIKNDEPVGVSMGCSVTHDICSICGNKATKRSEYCDHLRYQVKSVLSDGRKVCAKNPAPLKFFDLSLVNRPADPVAWDLAKVASEGEYGPSEAMSVKSSAELGEEYEYQMEKVAAVTKLGDMIKKLEGDIAALKDSETSEDEQVIKPLLQLRDAKPKEFDYPNVPLQEMSNSGLKPGGYLRIVITTGGAPSFSEIIPAVLRRFMDGPITGDMVNQVFSAIPDALEKLKDDPDLLDKETEVLKDEADDELFKDEGKVAQLCRIFEPIMGARSRLFYDLAGDQLRDLKKTASAVYENLPSKSSRSTAFHKDLPRRQLQNLYYELSTKGPGNMEKYVAHDEDGNEYYTTHHLARRDYIANDAIQKFFNMIPGAALSAAAIGALLSNRTMLEKGIAVPLLLMGGQALLKGEDLPVVQTSGGVEIPASTTWYKATKNLQKTAALTLPPHLRKDIVPLMSMAVPASLGMDYIAAKHIVNRNDPYYDQRPMSVAKRLGKTVAENPFTSVVLSGIAGKAGHQIYRDTLASRLAKLRRG